MGIGIPNRDGNHQGPTMALPLVADVGQSAITDEIVF